MLWKDYKNIECLSKEQYSYIYENYIQNSTLNKKAFMYTAMVIMSIILTFIFSILPTFFVTMFFNFESDVYFLIAFIVSLFLSGILNYFLWLKGCPKNEKYYLRKLLVTQKNVINEGNSSYFVVYSYSTPLYVTEEVYNNVNLSEYLVLYKGNIPMVIIPELNLNIIQ